MTYGYHTPRYKIPAPTYGQLVESFEERTQAQIVEQQLLGAIRQHGGHGVIKRGVFTGSISGSTGEVTLATNGSDYALEAYIRDIYVNPQSVLTWDSLPDGTVSYLYVELVEENPLLSSYLSSRQFGDVNTGSNTTGIIPANAILVAAALVDVGGGTVIINESPVGLISLPRLQDHIATSGNPHGALLEQDYMFASGVQVIDTLAAEDIYVGQRILVSGPSFFDGSVVFSNQTIFVGETFMSGRLFHQARVHYRSGVAYGAYRHFGSLKAQDIDVTNQAILSGKVEIIDQLTFSSGARINNDIDPNELKRTVDGSNIDGFSPVPHFHNRSNIDPRVISSAPHYKDSFILSGMGASGYAIGIDKIAYVTSGKWFAPGGGPYFFSEVEVPVMEYDIVEDYDTSHKLPAYKFTKNQSLNSGARAVVLAHFQLPLDFKYFDQSSGIKIKYNIFISGVVPPDPLTAPYRIRIWDTDRILRANEQIGISNGRWSSSAPAGGIFPVGTHSVVISSGTGVFEPGKTMTVEYEVAVSGDDELNAVRLSTAEIWYRV